MSADSSTSSSLYLLAPTTTSASTNIVDEALLASGEDTESDSPVVPWRTAADTPLPPAIVPYLGHTTWRANHPPVGEIRHTRVRRVRFVRVRRTKRRIVYEDGISRDFFLIMALCFVLACLLIVSLRPIALEILWYMDD